MVRCDSDLESQDHSDDGDACDRRNGGVRRQGRRGVERRRRFIGARHGAYAPARRRGGQPHPWREPRQTEKDQPGCDREHDDHEVVRIGVLGAVEVGEDRIGDHVRLGWDGSPDRHNRARSDGAGDQNGDRDPDRGAQPEGGGAGRTDQRPPAQPSPRASWSYPAHCG